MTGYHYTSLTNYWHILNEGLVPYNIKKDDLKIHFPDGINGIWLWKDNLHGDEQLGSILWQLMTKSDTRVVKLQVYYDESNLLKREEFPVEILHDGKLGSWSYHSKVPAIILTKPIETKFIFRMATYDLVNLLNC